MDKHKIVAELSEQRTAARTDVDAILAGAVDAEGKRRTLNEDESQRFDAASEQIKALDADIQRYRDAADADRQHEEAVRSMGAPKASVEVTREPEVYRRGSSETSYFRDLFTVRQNRPGADKALERLQRNDAMVTEKRAPLSTSNGAGGEFVPPLWLESDFVRYARPGRIFANLVPTQPLPAGTDSINIPKVATGTATAAMAGQNTGIPETDLTTTSVASSVVTIAGGQTVSLQLLEQSPVNVDGIVLQDLAAAYAVSLDSYLLTGTGASGQPLGVMNVSGINAIDCPAPTGSQTAVGQLYKAVGNAKAQIHAKRFMPAEVIFMTPTRWEWLLTQVDASGRPLAVPAAGQGSNFNLLGLAAEVAAQGYMGTFNGLPVYADALIPTNLTADSGTGEDAVIVARISDLILWESDIRAEAFQQTYAQNMSVFVRLYNYASFQPARYVQSISVITGSNLATANLFA